MRETDYPTTCQHKAEKDATLARKNNQDFCDHSECWQEANTIYQFLRTLAVGFIFCPFYDSWQG